MNAGRFWACCKSCEQWRKAVSVEIHSVGYTRGIRKASGETRESATAEDTREDDDDDRLTTTATRNFDELYIVVRSALRRISNPLRSKQSPTSPCGYIPNRLTTTRKLRVDLPYFDKHTIPLPTTSTYATAPDIRGRRTPTVYRLIINTPNHPCSVLKQEPQHPARSTEPTIQRVTLPQYRPRHTVSQSLIPLHLCSIPGLLALFRPLSILAHEHT